MKDHTDFVTPQFIEEKSKKIAMLAGEIGFCLKTWLIIGLKEQESLGHNIAS
jgi:hypothetical protein